MAPGRQRQLRLATINERLLKLEQHRAAKRCQSSSEQQTELSERAAIMIPSQRQSSGYSDERPAGRAFVVGVSASSAAASDRRMNNRVHFSDREPDGAKRGNSPATRADAPGRGSAQGESEQEAQDDVLPESFVDLTGNLIYVSTTRAHTEAPPSAMVSLFLSIS